MLAVHGALAAMPAASAYPLDGYQLTGIRRLRGYQLAQEGLLRGPSLPEGARLPTSAIRLRLAEVNADFDITASTTRDDALQIGLERILARRAAEYAVALLDVTDPAHPRYAGLREGRTYLPGSVGKLLVMGGLFDALAAQYPDVEDRMKVLRETMVIADRFALSDSHAVPVVELDSPSMVHRPVQVGDRFSLYEWIDHAVSPSSNAAGSMSWKNALLLRRFGRAYPPSPEVERAFLADTPARELQQLAVETLEAPLRAAGLNPDGLRQGTMFTRGASRVVPGVSSTASPRELLRWLVRLEQGRLTDRWSSLEMKRLLYFTRRRYRYAVSPALDRAAVYFKSGSFYQCEPEPGFRCGQYRGNVTNIMNSVGIVETPARPRPEETQRVYLVALMSNVLRKNSAADHRDIATEIDALIAGLH